MEPSLATVIAILNQVSDEFRELRDGVLKAVHIATIDPEMALTRCRKVLEYVVREVFQRRYNEPPGTKPLENLLHRIVRDGFFPSRLEPYATSIRMLGNLGTHKFGESITSVDVYLSLTQLLPILEWYFESEKQLPIDLSKSTETIQPTPDPDLILAEAHNLMIEEKWLEAGRKFDEYTKLRPDEWEAQVSRGVAYANSRIDSATDLMSLRAYNEAILLASASIDENRRARIFSYRGAMLKRLRRLEEAEADLNIALKLASRSYEIDDIRYNLAGVYALRGERNKMLGMIRELRNRPRMLAAIRAHLHDYFAEFINDDEFLRAIGSV